MSEIDIQKNQRTADLHLRVSPAEMALIKEAAVAHERVISDWSRRALLEKARRVVSNGRKNGREGS